MSPLARAIALSTPSSRRSRTFPGSVTCPSTLIVGNAGSQRRDLTSGRSRRRQPAPDQRRAWFGVFPDNSDRADDRLDVTAVRANLELARKLLVSADQHVDAVAGTDSSAGLPIQRSPRLLGPHVGVFRRAAREQVPSNIAVAPRPNAVFSSRRCRFCCSVGTSTESFIKNHRTRSCPPHRRLPAAIRGAQKLARVCALNRWQPAWDMQHIEACSHASVWSSSVATRQPRLSACLSSRPAGLRGVVYVDSGSHDDSVRIAASTGVEVVKLSADRPFTAARARNAGLLRLLELCPEIDKVQFIDGDCTLAEGWLELASSTLDERPDWWR